MTKSAMKAVSAKKIRTGMILLLITAIFSYFGSSLFSGRAVFINLGQIFQWLSLIVSPILIYRALSAEEKWARRFEKKYAKPVSLLKKFLVAVFIFTFFLSAVNYISDKIMAFGFLSLLKSAFSVISVFFSYYFFITAYSIYFSFSDKKSPLVTALARVSSAVGVIYIVLKLYIAVANVTSVNKPGFFSSMTVVGVICCIFYLIFIAMLTFAADFYTRSADLETETYRNPRLEKNKDKKIKGTYIDDKKKLYGIDEDEYVPLPEPSEEESEENA